MFALSGAPRSYLRTSFLWQSQERLFFVLLRTFALSALQAEVRISNGFPQANILLLKLIVKPTETVANL